MDKEIVTTVLRVSVSILAILVTLVVVLLAVKRGKNVSIGLESGDKKFGLILGSEDETSQKGKKRRARKTKNNDKATVVTNDIHSNEVSNYSNCNKRPLVISREEISEIIAEEYKPELQQLLLNHIEQHQLFTYGFSFIRSKESISDKIYLKIISKQPVNDKFVKQLKLFLIILKELTVTYTNQYKEFMDKTIEILKDSFDNIAKIDELTEDLIDDIECGRIVSSAINQYKSHNQDIFFFNDDTDAIIMKSIISKVYDSFENRVSKIVLNLVSDLKMVKSMSTVKPGESVSAKAFDIMTRVTKTYDSIEKHLCILFIECRPSMIEDIANAILSACV